MERLEGTFYKLRRSEEKGELYSWNKRGWEVALDIAMALAYLHARDTTHFDVKSGKFLPLYWMH